MRSSSGLWGFKWASGAQAVLVFLSACVAAALKAKPEQWGAKLGAAGPILSAALKNIQDHAWWLTPSMLFLVGALKFVKNKLGAPETWKELQRIVDDIRSDVYGAQTGQYEHHHRVTVYQYRRRWIYWKPGTWWLLPLVRSGHTSKSNVRKFRVHPNSPGCRNGLAGRAWESEGAIHVERLPVLGKDCSDEDFERYAEDTNIAVEDLRKKRSSSRSYWAVKVRRKGEPWGALVLDSVSETLNKKKADGAFKQHAGVLSLLLPRV